MTDARTAPASVPVSDGSESARIAGLSAGSSTTIVDPRSVGPREALTVDCPICQATSGDFCRVASDRPKQYPHGERYAAARDARPNNPAIWQEVRAERVRAHAKHAETSMESAPADDPTGRRLRILLEEVGEVAKEFNDAEHDQRPVDLAAVRKELIQVAAMAGAWADVIA